MSGIRIISERKLKKQEELFIRNELPAMGPGDPNGKPGTRGYQNGK